MIEVLDRAPEEQKVIDFRLQWLLHAGYKVRNAEKIAKDLSIDWHFAVKLHDECEDEKLCMRILFGRP